MLVSRADVCRGRTRPVVSGDLVIAGQVNDVVDRWADTAEEAGDGLPALAEWQPDDGLVEDPVLGEELGDLS
jgi:hypothetical protein